MEGKKAASKWKELWGRYQFVVLVAVVGIAFLVWPTGEKKSGAAQATPKIEAEDTTLAQTEARMEEILAKIDGVGELDLMLTLDKSAKQQYVQDSELSYSGPTNAPEDYARKSSNVVLSQGAGQEGLLLEESVYPTYRGALVVCQGGNNPEVKLAVTQAVAALTGLRTDRVTVTA